jgi:hypothetical protein
VSFQLFPTLFPKFIIVFLQINFFLIIMQWFNRFVNTIDMSPVLCEYFEEDDEAAPLHGGSRRLLPSINRQVVSGHQ